MQTPEFQQILLLHNKVQDVWCFNAPPTPFSAHATQLVQEVGSYKIYKKYILFIPMSLFRLQESLIQNFTLESSPLKSSQVYEEDGRVD